MAKELISGNYSLISSTVVFLIILAALGKAIANPDSTPPSKPSELRATAGTERIDLSWTASVDNVSVAGYEIERSPNGTDQWAKIATVTACSYSDIGLAPGTAYYYRVRAYDMASNFSEYSNIAAAITPTVIRYEESSVNVVYTGTWSSTNQPQSSGGAVKYSIGNSATFTFRGTSVAWIATKSSDRGMAKVFVDGILQQEVDLYSPETNYQEVVFTKNGLAPDVHSIKVEMSNKRNALSTGFGIDVDAFDVTINSKRYEESDPAVSYVGAWNSSADWGNSADNMRASNVAGDSATLTFTGANITWIGKKDSNRGIAKVYVDGIPNGEIDCYSSSPTPMVALFVKKNLVNGQHTLRIEVSGSKNAYSSDYFVPIDCFDVEVNIAPPATPTGLKAIGSMFKVDLFWNPNAEGDIIGYNVYRTKTSGSGYAKLNPSPVADLSYTDNETPTSGTTYYAVTAVDSGGNESPKSAEVSVTSGEVSCWGCHEAVRTSHQDCLHCHSGGTFPRSNLQPTNVVTQFGNSALRVHRASNDSCLKCHNPSGDKDSRGKYYPKLLRSRDGSTGEFRFAGNAFCYSCHGPSNSYGLKDQRTFEAGAHSDPRVNPSSGSNIKCFACHQKHGSSFAKLLRGDDPILCYDCHDKTENSQSGISIKNRFSASSSAYSRHFWRGTEAPDRANLAYKVDYYMVDGEWPSGSRGGPWIDYNKTTGYGPPFVNLWGPANLSRALTDDDRSTWYAWNTGTGSDATGHWYFWYYSYYNFSIVVPLAKQQNVNKFELIAYDGSLSGSTYGPGNKDFAPDKVEVFTSADASSWVLQGTSLNSPPSGSQYGRSIFDFIIELPSPVSAKYVKFKVWRIKPSVIGVDKAELRVTDLKVFGEEQLSTDLCWTCHEPHEVNRIYKVSDPMTGKLLKSMVVNPATGQYVYDQISFCLTCHDGDPPAGFETAKSFYDVIGNYLYWSSNLPWPSPNPTTVGDPHGAKQSSWNFSRGELKAPYARNMAPLFCTECHDPHGSANVYHLKETVNGVTVGTISDPWGRGAANLCAGCHSGTYYDWHVGCDDRCHNHYVEGDFGPIWIDSVFTKMGSDPACFYCHNHNGFTHINEPWGAHHGCGTHGNGCHDGYEGNFYPPP